MKRTSVAMDAQIYGVHQAANEASGAAWTDVASASLRVFVARSATPAAARTKMPPISSPRWKPDVSACATGVPVESRWFVPLVDTVVRTASPGVPPSCCGAFYALLIDRAVTE
jgi:hypothetical protein